ncbi:MAG: HAD-IA family hydrolase [Burkholderiaceae bacterium]|nr:HAD-IA family hydrolase [Burkholderiaceae bacterium]
MQPLALIFDVDGTLADTEEAHRLAFNRAFDQYDLDWRWSRARYAELLGVSGGRERIRRHLDSLALPPEERAALEARIDDIHRAKVEAYRELLEGGHVPLRPGMRRLIEEALASGVQLAVATTGTAAGVETLLARALGAGTVQRFAVIAAGDVVTRRKPAPDIYRYVLQRLQVDPRACVAFEDSANGVAAARGAGIFVVATPSFWTLDQDFSEADLFLPSLGDPDQPLPAAIAARRTGGAPYVDLALLRRLLAARDAGNPDAPAPLKADAFR